MRAMKLPITAEVCKIKIPNNPIAFLEWQYTTNFTIKLIEHEDYRREAMDNHPVYIMKK